MASKTTSDPKPFEEFDMTLAAVIKPGGEAVHYLMTLEGVEVQPATRTATLADAPEVIEDLTANLQEGYARYLTEQTAQAAKKTKRSSKKPVKKPAAKKPPQADEAEETKAKEEQEEVPPDEEQSEAPEEAEQDGGGEGEDEATPEESPALPTEQLSMLDGIDI